MNVCMYVCICMYIYIYIYNRRGLRGLQGCRGRVVDACPLRGLRKAGTQLAHTCHILPPSEIDRGLFLAVFAGSEGRYLFHRIG